MAAESRVAIWAAMMDNPDFIDLYTLFKTYLHVLTACVIFVEFQSFEFSGSSTTERYERMALSFKGNQCRAYVGRAEHCPNLSVTDGVFTTPHHTTIITQHPLEIFQYNYNSSSTCLHPLSLLMSLGPVDRPMGSIRP